MNRMSKKQTLKGMAWLAAAIFLQLPQVRAFTSQAPSAPSTSAAQGVNHSGHIIVLAKAGKNQRGGHRRHLSGEAKVKGGSTSINFDEASIEGSRRLPAGVAISKTNPDHGYDLVNLRLRWHPEMIQSTTNLETGQGR